MLTEQTTMGADPVEPTIYLLAPLNGGAILEAGGAAGSNLVSHWAILGWGGCFVLPII